MQRERKRRFGVNAIISWQMMVSTPKRLFLSLCISIPLLRLYTFFSRSQSVIIFSLNRENTSRRQAKKLQPLRKPHSASVYILANFWKVEVGTLEIWCDLDYDRKAMIIARAKPSKILNIETVKYEFLKVLVNDSTHLLQEKVGLKYIQFSCVQRKMTGEWTF